MSGTEAKAAHNPESLFGNEPCRSSHIWSTRHTYRHTQECADGQERVGGNTFLAAIQPRRCFSIIARHLFKYPKELVTARHACPKHYHNTTETRQNQGSCSEVHLTQPLEHSESCRHAGLGHLSDLPSHGLRHRVETMWHSRLPSDARYHLTHALLMAASHIFAYTHKHG